MTPGGPDGRRSGVRRLELKRVRVCGRCGRGRAELEGADGARIEVSLDAPRARELSGEPDVVRSLGAAVLAGFAENGTTLGEVVLDRGPAGLRALLAIARAGERDVVACSAQEGVELAVRAGVALYATDQALALDAGAARVSAPRHTLH